MKEYPHFISSLGILLEEYERTPTDIFTFEHVYSCLVKEQFCGPFRQVKYTKKMLTKVTFVAKCLTNGGASFIVSAFDLRS